MLLTEAASNNTNLSVSSVSNTQKFTMLGSSLAVATIVSTVAAIYFSAGIGLLCFTGASVFLEGSTITSIDFFRQRIKNKIEQNGLNLQHIPDWLKADREIVLAAVRQNGSALQFVQPSLRGNREIVLAAIKKNGLALEFAADRLKSDIEIVTAAIKKNGLALQFVPESLRNNLKIVTAAVTQNGLALQFVDESLREAKNNALVRKTIEENKAAFKLAAECMKNDQEFMLASVQGNRFVLQILPKLPGSNPKIATAAVKKNDPKWITPTLQSNRMVINVTLKQTSPVDGFDLLNYVETTKIYQNICETHEDERQKTENIQQKK